MLACGCGQQGDLPSLGDTDAGDPDAALHIEADIRAVNPFTGEVTVVPGELVVQVLGGVDLPRLAEAAGRAGASVAEFDETIGLARLHVAVGEESQAAATLALDPAVERVARNYRYPLDTLPDDPLYPDQWHLPAVRLPEAWDLRTDAPEVIVAVVDTGVDAGHPDLAGRLVSGWNFIDGNTSTGDVHGHGTAVAGVIAAAADNAVGVAGAVWDGRVMPLRVATPDGTAATTDIAAAVIYAVEHGADIINISMSAVVTDPFIQAACQYAAAQGLAITASGGNTGRHEDFPDSPWVLSVGATTITSTLATFSTTGPHIDVVAPGDAVLTTARGGGYVFMSGTSFSAPLAAGVLALMRAHRPDLPAQTLVSLLTSEADDLGQPGRDDSYGFGLISARRALDAARTLDAAPDTDPPTLAFDSLRSGDVLSAPTPVILQAADDSIVTAVTLALDDTPPAADATAPYAFLLDPVDLPEGDHLLTATARDAAGNETRITLTIRVAEPDDTTPPAVDILAPASGAAAAGLVTIRAAVRDDVRVARLRVLLDGEGVFDQPLAHPAVEATFRWDTTANPPPPGDHVIAIEATDLAGNRASATITLTSGQ